MDFQSSRLFINLKAAIVIRRFDSRPLDHRNPPMMDDPLAKMGLASYMRHDISFFHSLWDVRSPIEMAMSSRH